MTKNTKKAVKKTGAPKKAQSVKKDAKKSAENAQSVKKERVTLAQKRDEIIAQLALNERVALENEKSAVNKENSAMYTCDNCVMLSLYSDEKKSAKRVLEIWAHSKRFDVVVARELLDTDELKQYKQFADEKQTKRAIVKLADEKQAIDFANALIKIL